MATLTSSPTAATASRGARARTRTSRAGASSSGSPGRRSSTGFTFIELAVVLLLVGILLFFAVPRFGHLTQGGLKAAARQMYGVIATAHDNAALQKRRYWLAMEVGRGEWWVVATEPSEGLSAEAVLERRDKALMDGTLPGEVLFSDVVLEGEVRKEGTALAVFEPNGTCSQAQVHLEDEAGDLYTLVVNPLTGRATVADSYLEPPEPVSAEEGAGEQLPPAGQEAAPEAPQDAEETP